MANKIVKTLLAFFIFIAHLSLSYYYFGHWWNSSLGTALIVFLCFVLWRKKFDAYTGLKINLQSAVISVVLLFLLTAASYYLMNFLAQKRGVELLATNWKNYYHICFYVLNEELVFGALILLPLMNNRKLHPLLLSFGLALIFSLGHYVFYKWIFIDRGVLQLTTLVVLFMVGFLRNNLILGTGHIAYSWALHYAWMVVMFGFKHCKIGSDKCLTELERFNLYLGSNQMLLLSILAGGLSLFFLKRKMVNPKNGKF